MSATSKSVVEFGVGTPPQSPSISNQDAVDGVRNYRAAKEAELRTAEIKARISANGRLANPNDIVLEVAYASDTTIQLDYLFEPYLPMKQVVGFYGRGGTAKTSFVATLAAQIGAHSSTVWISTEEDISWIKVRHIKTGGGDGTLFVFKAISTKLDADGRVSASTFNIYEHLDATIASAKARATATAPYFADGMKRPVQLVVLDAAVALTTWGKGESPNDDASVKRLIAYLYSLCEKYAVTIALIGHINKGKHEHLAETVAGSGSWTSSLRQAFMHIHDPREEYAYVLCTVKDTLTGPFATSYSTHPVHTLAHRSDGSDSVLCAVEEHPIQWGHKNVKTLMDKVLSQRDDSVNRQLPAHRKWAQVNAVVDAVLALIDSGAKPVNRKAVQDALGVMVNPRHWQESDQILSLLHSIKPIPGPHGELAYERQLKG